MSKSCYNVNQVLGITYDELPSNKDCSTRYKDESDSKNVNASNIKIETKIA